ncbi:hypothetical protein ACFXOI_32540, partial [Streptomyces bacillaris]
AKAEGKPLPAPAEDEGKEKGEVVDLMAALNASVKAAKDSRGEDGEDATVHEMRPSKKTRQKKTPAKKTAARKRSASTEEEARTLARYKKAKETERELKPVVRAIGLEGLREGATPAQLSELTGESAETFRRIRDAHDIPIDPRYESRARLARARKPAVPDA